VPAKTPEEICRLFQEYMQRGDLDALLTLYDSQAVFLNRPGELKKGESELRHELAHFANLRAVFEYRIKQVIQCDDIALMHTEWKIVSPEPMSVYAIEVARRQRDGSWRWLIGDPFTVGRKSAWEG
jgi:ketosteroid isomerase-like protein